MEDSFRVRLDKVFGSLASSFSSSNNNNNDTPSSLSLTSLWSLSDHEIERKEWKRDTDHPDDQRFLFPEDHGDKNNSKKKKMDKPVGRDDDQEEEEEYRDIRSSIGLDCTLDFEEEEDQYDKVAVGRETAGDILCMGDVVDYGIEVNAHNELPSSFDDAPRDSRANHMAAKLRIREDAEAAGGFDTLKLSKMYVPSLVIARSKEVQDVIIPKPILKKREKPMDKKSPKRVCFHVQPLGAKGSAMGSYLAEETSSLGEAFDLPANGSFVLDAKASDEASSLPPKSSSNEESDVVDDVSSLPRVSTCIPDYLRNPTRYTRYNLDSSNDMDEESNWKAYMGFLNQLNKPNPAEMQLDEAAVSVRHPLTFTPKKQQHGTSLMDEIEFRQNQGEVVKDKPCPVGIAASDTHSPDSEVCAMEEDGFEMGVRKSSKKPGRRYRTRTRTDVDSDDHVT